MRIGEKNEKEGDEEWKEEVLWGMGRGEDEERRKGRKGMKDGE